MFFVRFSFFIFLFSFNNVKSICVAIETVMQSKMITMMKTTTTTSITITLIATTATTTTATPTTAKVT